MPILGLDTWPVRCLENIPEFYFGPKIHEPPNSFGHKVNRFSLAVVHSDARFRKAMIWISPVSVLVRGSLLEAVHL